MQKFRNFYGQLFEVVGQGVIEQEVTVLAQSSYSVDISFDTTHYYAALVDLSYYSDDANASDIKVALDTPDKVGMSIGGTNVSHQYGPFRLGYKKSIQVDSFHRYPALIPPKKSATITIYNESSPLATRTYSYTMHVLFLRKLEQFEIDELGGY